MLRAIRQGSVIFLIAAIRIGLTVAACSAAAPTLKLVVNPNTTTFAPGAEPVVFTVIARGKNLTFAWQLVGPGALEGEGSAVFYNLPETIAGTSAQARITVTVTNESGEAAAESVTLTILTPLTTIPTSAPSPMSSPTPKPAPDVTMTPTPRPTPTRRPFTPTPTPLSEIDQLLQAADAYFKKQAFLTPEDKSAYTLYQEVLRRDPANPHAREKLYAMLRVYQAWGDENYSGTNYPKAKVFYQRYLKIAQYLLESLNDQGLAPEIEAIQKRVQELDLPTPTAVPRPTPKPLITQPPAAPTPTPLPILPTALPQQFKTWVEPVTGMEFVWVPGGCFNMGSPQGESGRSSGESPIHQACVPDLWIGTYEVTQEQWQKMMGDNPSDFNSSKIGEDARKYPVEQVSWNDVQKFLSAFKSKTGMTTVRLPSEAEWEYACRTGSNTMYAFGDDLGSLAQYAWYRDNSAEKTHPVGQLTPNAWGLYDMHGNVWEWCADPGHNNYNEAPSDGSVWESGGDMSIRTLRGGSWNSHPWGLRSANRLRNKPDYRSNSIGFRVVRSGGADR